jgi:CRP-like cAMP-binding protein
MNPDEQLFQRFGKEFPRGSILFREGEPGRDMFVVHEGRVRISKSAGGQEAVLGTLGPGEFFGEMSILSGNPRSATATCDTTCKLLVVDQRTFEAMIRGHGEIALRMIRTLADRLQHANEQIENLLLPDASMRVVHWLLVTSEREVRSGSGGAPRVIALDEVASRVGIPATQAKDVVQRVARTRVIQVSSGGVSVPDVERLRQFLAFLKMKSQFGELA